MILTVAMGMTIQKSNHIQWKNNKNHNCWDWAVEMENILPVLDRK